VKRQTWLSGIVLLSMILIPLASPLAAQETAKPARVEVVPEWGGTWQLGPTTAFQFTRFDGGFYPGDGMVYFMGGRLADSSTDGSVWSFDPVAETYGDMGVDLVTPISNYTMNLLQDGAGAWGFYTLCGRPAAGGITTAVQIYYPDANTAVQLDPADNFPEAGGCTSALNVVLDNKVYVAGGFDSVNPTYDYTYVFDPTAPVGSKWTPIPSATLNLGRAYIMGALVDGEIYAIGGAYFEAGGLINTTMVEVMDPAAPSPTWDDASVADLPEECSSSRAYGFDSDSPFVDPDGTPFGAKIVSGCGFWADENNHVYVYDTVANFWEPFPFLNVDRRDEAGELLPISGGGGLPGMWVWGGRKDSDSNVLTSSEFYAFASLVSLVPPYQEESGGAGEVIDYSLDLVNLTGQEDTFDISYGGNLWDVSAPLAIGPVGDGEVIAFTVSVTIPLEVLFPDEDTVVITATAQSDPEVFGTAQVKTFTMATVDGHIYDANTGDPLAGFVTLYDADDPDVYFEAFADENGYYNITEPNLALGEYDIYGAMVGWYRVDDTVVLTGVQTDTLDFHLPAPIMSVVPGEIDATVPPSQTRDIALGLINAGTGDLTYRIDEIAPGTGFMPAGVEPAQPAGVDPQVYADLAASPHGTAEILVIMAEQADLSAAYGIADWSARGQYVYDTLKATADRTQAAVRAYLDGQGVPYRSHISLNSLTLTASEVTVNALAAIPEVGAIRPGYTYEIPRPIVEQGAAPEAIPWNLANIHADQVWEDLGVTGQGIVVANIDTGVAYTHEALVEQYRGNLGDGTFDHNYNWWDPRGACEIAGFPAGEPCDNDSHGTHTMGTMVGSDDPAHPITATNAIGVAPGAQWMACKGCEYVEGWPCSTFALLECADFVLAPWDLNMENPDPDMRPNVVNNSWGGGPNDGWYFNAVAAWRAAGIFPAFSAGNAGPSCNTVNSPSDYDNAFASGAVDISDTIANFSSRGPSDLGVMKPQVTAPGVNVRSSVPGNGYANFGGTSMASPHSAGEVALIWSAQPDLLGNVQLTEWLMEQTADPILDNQCGPEGPPNYVYGWGRINAYNAVTTALSYEWDVDWLSVSPGMGTVAPGEAAEIAVTLDATGLMTGCFTSTLKIETNDPYLGLDTFVPVQMCVGELMLYLPVLVK
jgi:subtilisin family serine protease